jgi:K+-sensing histidine kinase KdpD
MLLSLIPRSGRAPDAGLREPPELSRTEAAMRRVRWLAAAFTLLQFALYRPPVGIHVPFPQLLVGAGVAGVLVLTNLVSAVACRRGKAPWLARLGLIELGVDTGLVIVVVWLFAFDVTSALWALLILPVLEGALRLQLRGAAAAWAVTAVAYTLRELWASHAYSYVPFQLESVTYRCGIVLIVALASGYLARDLTVQMGAARTAQHESDNRACLLRLVAAASKSINSLDPAEVLDLVVESALVLGFDAANVCVLSEDETTYEVVSPRGMPGEYASGTHPASVGMAGLVLDQRGTVVVDDYRALPTGVPYLRREGFRVTIAAPVRCTDRLAAVLVAASHHSRRLSTEEIEAFEMLADQAGRALENARRFEDERRTVERLNELDRLKSNFIATVSHELRTPLTVVMGAGDLLQHRWARVTEADRTDLLARISANARTLEGIISTLLDVSQLEAGQLRPVFGPFDLSGSIAAAAARLGPVMEDHRLVVEAEGSIVAVADAALVDRVLDNLLANAAKHTPPGTTVRLEARRQAASAVVSVSDDGPGIPRPELDHICERFYRGRRANELHVRGMGLGLALVKEILTLHETTLAVESRPGEGTSFAFSLPLGEVASAAS